MREVSVMSSKYLASVKVLGSEEGFGAVPSTKRYWYLDVSGMTRVSSAGGSSREESQKYVLPRVWTVGCCCLIESKSVIQPQGR